MFMFRHLRVNAKMTVAVVIPTRDYPKNFTIKLQQQRATFNQIIQNHAVKDNDSYLSKLVWSISFEIVLKQNRIELNDKLTESFTALLDNRGLFLDSKDVYLFFNGILYAESKKPTLDFTDYLPSYAFCVIVILSVSLYKHTNSFILGAS